LTLYYQEYGDKNAPFMLFLHGGGVSGWMWDQQINYFTHYHCVVPDLPEQGESLGGQHFSIKNSAEMLIDLIEKEAQGKKVIVIGFSLGAQIAIHLLSIKPDLVDYAIINSALVRPSKWMKSMFKPMIHLSFPLIQNKTFSKMQAKTLYVGPDHFEKYYQESSQMKPETLIRILEENLSFKIPDGFSHAVTKILVTVGEREMSIMKTSARDIVKSNPHCKGVIIPAMGHGLPMAKPELFNRMIEAWIAETALPEEGDLIKI
jgi:pimeloyl-ACP methyl ester carboxylesterase